VPYILGRRAARAGPAPADGVPAFIDGAAVLAVSQAVIQPLGHNPNLSPAAQGIINTASTVTLAALPVGLAVAIMRYRLYEIDRIISRTLAYAIVTGLLVGVYAGLVLRATEVLSVKIPGRGRRRHAGGRRASRPGQRRAARAGTRPHLPMDKRPLTISSPFRLAAS